MKCPTCGKFLKDVDVKLRVLDDRIFVKGTCKTHGDVEPTDWDADMFTFEDYKDEVLKELEVDQ